MIIANCSLRFSDNYFSSARVVGDSESAGMNRHVVGDERALQERK
jgi:hypothetical protein